MQTVADTLANNPTWVDFAYHVFDKIWAYAISTGGGLLAGWLLMNKPNWMRKNSDPLKLNPTEPPVAP